MTAPTDDLLVRRVLVALDPSAPGVEAMAAAVRLAVRAGAEVVGIFVEDVSLLRLAALPAVRFVASATSAPRRIDVASMEHEIHARGELARVSFRAEVERTGVRSSFRSVRGEITSAIVTASGAVDMVVLALHAASRDERRALAETARQIAVGAGRPVILHRAGETLRSPVLLYDGTAGSQRALAAAAYLARHDGGRVAVLAVGDSEEQARAAGDDARRRLGARGVSADVHVAGSSGAERVLLALSAARGDALVVAADTLARAGSLEALIERSGRPVVVTR